LEMAILMGVFLVQVLFSTIFSLDLEVVCQLLSLSLHNVYLVGFSEGLTALCNIIGCFPS
jgi:hypothetical protein